MAADAFIQCRVTPEMKTLVRALAEREHVTESALVKQLLEVVLRTSSPASHQSLDLPETAKRDARLYVRMDPEDRFLLVSRAKARGMRSATYVSLLVRSHLRSVAPIPKDELLALKRSVAELSAIGRNLNQIAMALNKGNQAQGPGPEHLRGMLRVAEGLRDHFKGLLKANVLSWESSLVTCARWAWLPTQPSAQCEAKLDHPSSMAFTEPRGAAGRRMSGIAWKQSSTTCARAVLPRSRAGRDCLSHEMTWNGVGARSATSWWPKANPRSRHRCSGS